MFLGREKQDQGVGIGQEYRVALKELAKKMPMAVSVVVTGRGQSM